MCLYLVSISIMLALTANKDSSVTGSQLITGVLPFIVTIDFLMRFVVQQTPSQLIKPYILLPIPRYSCINYFVISSLLSYGNLIWFALFLPYIFMAVLFAEGAVTAVVLLLSLYFVLLVNSQWYLIVRTLVNDKLYWWFLPAIIYLILYLPLYNKGKIDFDFFCTFYSHFGTIVAGNHAVLLLLSLLVLLTVVSLINRRIQFVYTWKELGKNTRSTLNHVSSLSYMNRFGEIGEYLKLETKSIMRNKNQRKAFVSALIVIVIFSALISYTDIYDGTIMKFFWIFYNFVIIGAMLIVKLMCYEGNYIDGLLIRKENIYSLLIAKYYLYSSILFLPFILLLPTLFTGKSSLLQLLSVMIFTSGACYFLFFQMAVYNKTTIPLNEKMIAKTGIENNYIQVLAELGVFLFPVSVYSLLYTFCGETAANVILLIIGLCFILTHKLWIRNIYNRLMKRKYTNLEGFRASRK